MTIIEDIEKEIEKINKEMLRMEQLNMVNDKYYHVLAMERLAKFYELEFCKENNL